MDSANVDDPAFQLESRLMSHGIYVTEVVTGEDTVELTYESMAADRGLIPHREVGKVINVFRDLHDDDWSGVDIDVTVLDLDGTEQGTWRVEAAWIDELHNGDLSETEFSAKVIETIG